MVSPVVLSVPLAVRLARRLKAPRATKGGYLCRGALRGARRPTAGRLGAGGLDYVRAKAAESPDEARSKSGEHRDVAVEAAIGYPLPHDLR